MAIASYRRTVGAVLLTGMCAVAACLAVCCFANAQVAYQEREVRVHDLPLLTARSMHASDALATSLEIVFHDKQICCGKNSALEDSVQSSDPKSLKDIDVYKRQPEHIVGLGAHRCADSNFARPLIDSVGEHSVNADNGKCQCQKAKYP